MDLLIEFARIDLGVKFIPKASEDLEQTYSYIAGKLFAETAAQFK